MSMSNTHEHLVPGYERTHFTRSAAWAPYGFAFGMVLLAWGGTYLIKTVVPDRHFSLILFFAAVAVSAGLGGLRAGVFATLLSALTCDYFFLPPYHTLTVGASDLPLLVLFIMVALLINGLSGRLHAQTRHADARFYQLVQGLDGIVWEANPKTRQFTFVSARAESLLGYSIQEWLSEPDFRSRITPPCDLERVQNLCEKALSEGGEHTADYRVLTISGQEVWLRETIYVQKDTHGRPIRMSGLSIDITERKIASEELSLLKDELVLLNSITAAVSASLELPAFLDILQTQLREQLNVEAGAIFLADERDGQLILSNSWGLPATEIPDWRIGKSLPPSHPPDMRPAPALPAIPSDVIQLPVPAGLQQRGWSETLAIPLLANEELLGGLMLYSRKSLYLHKNRLAFFSAMGRQLGTLLQNATLYQAVHDGRERLQNLSRQLVQVQESERRALARELHDEIGQVLTGVKLTLEICARLPLENRTEQLHKALDLVQELMKQVDALSLDLRPAMLDNLGLLPSLHWHCERYTALCGVRVKLIHSELERRFLPEVEITVYRIIQEALTNAARHARVDEVDVRLWSTRDIIGLQVADKGCGFDRASVLTEKKSGGLTGMQERAALMGGEWSIETGQGAGTCITVELPLSGQTLK